MVQPADLLARLVNILGYIPPQDDLDWENEDQTKQANVQNDDQNKPIDQGLANNIPQWKIGGEKFPFTKPRSRATSEVRLQTTKDDYTQQNVEWTWSGPVASKKLQELMKARDRTLSKDSGNKPYKKFPSFALPITASKNFFPRWRRQSSNKKISEINSNMKNIEKVDDSEKSNQQNNLISSPISSPTSYLDERRDSISRKPYYYTHTGSNLSTYLEGNNLLEETSLADFLRALTALHARVGPDDYVVKPKRKLGTACLSPPKLPSLFTLFSSNAPGSGSTTQSNQNTITEGSYQSNRRMSLKMLGNSGSTTPTAYAKKENIVKPRRFSLRPVITPVNPSTPTDYGSPRLSVSLYHYQSKIR